MVEYFKSFRAWLYIPDLPGNQKLVYTDTGTGDVTFVPLTDDLIIGEDDKWESADPQLYHNYYNCYHLSKGKTSTYYDLRDFFGDGTRFELDGLTFAADIWAINGPNGNNPDITNESISVSGPHYRTVPLNYPKNLDIAKVEVVNNEYYFRLNWSDDSYNEKGYNIQKSYDGAEFFTIDTLENGPNGDYNQSGPLQNSKDAISYDLPAMDYDTFVQCAFRIEAFNDNYYEETYSDNVVLNKNRAGRADESGGDIMIFPFPAPEVDPEDIEVHEDVAPPYPVLAFLPIDILGYSEEQFYETEKILVFRRLPTEEWVQLPPVEDIEHNTTLYIVLDNGDTTGEYSPLIEDLEYEYAVFTANGAWDWSLYWWGTKIMTVTPW